MERVRQRRSVWVGIFVVVVFFAGVTVAIALVGDGGPDIPHSVDGDRAACTACHPTDELPDGHQGRIDDSCGSCHSKESADAAGRVHEAKYSEACRSGYVHNGAIALHRADAKVG